jgi:hypothetical protein
VSQPTTNGLKIAAALSTVALLTTYVGAKIQAAQLQQAAADAAADAGQIYDAGPPPPPLDHIRLGTAPVGSYALWATSLAAPAIQYQVLNRVTAQSVYVRSKVCAVPLVIDGGGSDPGQYVVPGLVVTYDDDTTQPCDPATDAALEAWTQDAVGGAPWPGACAADATCVVDGGAPAPLGITLAPGTFAGPGCVLKPLVELSGISSWPAACPLH